VKIENKKNIFEGHIRPKEKIQKVKKYRILAGKVYKAKISEAFWKGTILPTCCFVCL